VYEHGKVKTSTKQRFQDGNTCTENEEYKEFDHSRHSNPLEHEQIFTNFDRSFNYQESNNCLPIRKQSKNIIKEKDKKVTPESNNKPQKSKKAATKKSKTKI